MEHIDNSTTSKAELLAHIADLEAQVKTLEHARLEDQFRLDVYKRMPVAAMIIERETGIILDHNETTKTMFGYSDSDLIQQSIQILLTDDYQTHNFSQYHNWQGEMSARRYDGTQFWCEVSITSEHHFKHGDVLVVMFHDIDERTKATIDTLKSQALYLSLVDTLPHLIYRADAEGRLLFINQALQDIIKRPYHEMIGQPITEIFQSFTSSPLVVDDRAVIHSKMIQNHTITIAHPETLDDMSLTITKLPITDEFGDIKAVQTLIEDTTERTQAVQDLHTSRNALQNLIEQLPVGIQVFDAQGLCVDVNEAHLKIFGRTRQQLVNTFNIFDDKLSHQVATVKAAKRALRGETVTLGDITFDFSQADERFASTTQGVRIINVTMFPIIDHREQVTGFVGLNVDVTERHQREETLRRSEARYRAVVQDQRELISRYRPDGTLTFVNRAYADLVGIPETELIGKRWQDIVNDDIYQATVAKLSQITADNPTAYHEEEKVNPDGTSRWIQWFDRGLFDDDGTLVEYQGLGVDITEQKELEKQRFAVALEKERIQILSDFVIQASHEFRTPLSIINSSASILARQPDPDKRLERLEKINRQVDHISDLIDSMTLMSRLDRDLAEVTLVATDLNKLIQIAITRLHSKETDIAVTVNAILPEYPIRAKVLENDFVRVLELIGDNALKYSNDGGTVTITARTEDDHALITIKDEGIGMSDEEREQAFNRFYRADKSGKTSGLGLGLPISETIIRQFGGTINIESVLNVGTSVTIALPLVAST
ncbi:MAG: PAS domain-containing sensor histidine kinase [Chloroflexota bacterium]